MPKRPGGQLARRPLHFFWIADCSGSMNIDGKIQALNHAIKEAIPHMKKVAKENPNAEVFIRAIHFSSGAQWHIETPTPIEQFEWRDLQADGVTDMGAAFSLVAEQLVIPPMDERALPPVLALISDGQPTDEYQEGLNQIMALPWGKKAVRIAIAIGEDADEAILNQFMAHPTLRPLKANHPEALAKHIRWVSTAVLNSVSSPASQFNSSDMKGINVPISTPDFIDELDSVDDIW